jgi:alkanesulfonate monooxygenase SsuD/methylene tetrahydromethanopterin reductase-like flavin-dependent oxidoreductase (luciferase family)
MAAVTQRIRLTTSVIILPFHDPLRLAEDIAVLDIISGGRVD